MAEVIDNSEADKATEQLYSCETQEEEDPSFGPAPSSNLDGTTGDNAPDVPDSIVVGFGTIIPRWDVRRPGGAKLKYFVRTDTFPAGDRARLASTALKEAAKSWNDLNTGVTIVETTDRNTANFYLVYAVNPSGSSTLARAFFPHEVDQDVIVFSKAYDNVSILKNIFQHELGHVIGLRHEFAITGDPQRGLRPEGRGAIQLYQKNPISVMSYTFPPRIQQSDKDQVIKFYRLPNGHLEGRTPVTDFVPRIRRRN